MKHCSILSTLLCLMASPAFTERLALSAIPIADPVPVHPNSMFCEIVNGYIRLYGEVAAEKWARDHKWSASRIAEARECRKVKSS